MMTDPFVIEADAFYDDAAVRLETGITAGTLAKARKAGILRYTDRAGRNMYLGQWLLDWLTGDGSPEPSDG